MANIIVEIGALLLAIILFYLFTRVLKTVVMLAANSIGGIVIFFLLNMVFGLNIPIDLISVGVVAFAGLPGVILVLILHFLGLAF